MTEEEKKAINQLKYDTNFYDYELKNGNYIYELFKIEVYKKDVDVTLNLIEKLQKENLLLSAKENMSAYFEFKKNYIPKDKIRERLQKEYDLYNSKEQLKYSQDIIDVLEELLEEG